MYEAADVPGNHRSISKYARSRLGSLLETSDVIAFSCFAVIVIASLTLRVESGSYIMESLWGEDGNLLINQSHALGLRSLWEPLAGYLHLYHRLVALIATPAPLVVVPIIFLCGWIAAFLWVAWVITERARQIGLDRPAALFVILAISLQPNNGETFLNLSQSFYILNIALAIDVCFPSKRPITLPHLVFLGVLSLSGPASEILAVILIIRLALLRDFATRKGQYLVVWVGALIQIFYTFTSYAENGSVINTHVAEWLLTIVTFLSFGAKNNLVIAAAFAFWAITLVFVVKHQLNLNQPFAMRVGLLLLVLTSAAFFGAGALRQGDYMDLMNPIDHASRYYVLPYSLAFFAAFIVSRSYLGVRLAVLFALGLICGASFLTLDRQGREGRTGLYGHESMQWVAFNRFRQVDPEVVIPTNPAWAVWPPFWHVKVSARNYQATSQRTNVVPVDLDVRKLTSDNASLAYADDGVHVSSPDHGPQIRIPVGDSCPDSEYVALEAVAWTSGPGWTRLHWGNATERAGEKSLRRFYPDGDLIMQFAFPREPGVRILRLELLGGVERWLLQDLIPKGDHTLPFTAPPPSPPGGEVRIHKMRLFCLE